VKSLAEVVQPDGSTRWELVEMDEASQKKATAPVAEEKPVKRTRKVAAPVFSVDETPETPEF
jgi:hypothetical protein